MKVQNLNCDFLRIISDSYEKNYITNSLKSVELSIGINDGVPTSKIINVGNLTHSWTVQAKFNSLTKITQLYFKNLATGLFFPLLPAGSSYSVTEQNLVTIKTKVAETFSTVLGISGVIHTYEIIGTDTLKISYSRMPINLTANYLRTAEGTGQISKHTYFTYLDDSDIIFNGNHLLVKSSFFGDTQFKDGIYKVTFKTLDNNNIITREESCYFMDCTIAGSLISTIEVEECKESDIRMLMMHYSLRVASNRECDCDDMQRIFDFLIRHVDTSNTDPCGC